MDIWSLLWAILLIILGFSLFFTYTHLLWNCEFNHSLKNAIKANNNLTKNKMVQVNSNSKITMNIAKYPRRLTLFKLRWEKFVLTDKKYFTNISMFSLTNNQTLYEQQRANIKIQLKPNFYIISNVNHGAVFWMFQYYCKIYTV